MSDVTPIVGPVYGWRTWNVDGQESWALDGEPPRLTSRGGPWTDATQEAECRPGSFHVLTRDMFRTWNGGAATHEETVEHEPVTEPSCWCGLYAHATLANCLDKNPLLFDPHAEQAPKVLGLVSSSGRMIAAERGFRAQWMTVDTLVCIHHSGSGHQDEPVAAIAKGLGVGHVCVAGSSSDRDATRESFNSLFADRDGVYLWRKEAPWTSDVTSEPTRSSMWFRTGGTVPGMKPSTISFTVKDETWMADPWIHREWQSSERRSLPERLKDRWSIGRGGAA